MRNVFSSAAVAGAVALGITTVGAAPAQAEWRNFDAPGGPVAVLACKRATSSVYGPLWEVRLVAASSPGWSARMTFVVLRNGNVVNDTKVLASNGSWDVAKTYASRYYYDKYSVVWSAGSGQSGDGGSFKGYVKDLPSC